MNFLLIVVRKWGRSLGVNKHLSRLFQKLEVARIRKQPQITISRLSQGGVEIRFKDRVWTVRGETPGFFSGFESPLERGVLIHLLSGISSGAVVWDVGANVGTYTCLMASVAGESGKVYAFEPNPIACQQLRKHCLMNAAMNVEVFELALGDQVSRMDFAVETGFTPGGHVIQKETLADGGEVFTVSLVTGDSMVTQGRSEIPDVIKVDVEGYELEVLKGMRSTLAHPQCKTVICEVHFGALAQRGHAFVPLEIQSFLRDAGFCSLKWIDRSHLLAQKSRCPIEASP